MAGTIGQSRRTARQLTGAGIHLVCPGSQITDASMQSVNAVIQRTAALHQTGGGVGKLGECAAQLVKAAHVTQVQILQRAVFDRCHRGKERETGHIGLNGHGLRDVQIQGLAILGSHTVQSQALAETGHCHADGHGAVAGVENLAVGDGDVVCFGVVQHQTGHHQEGLIEGDGLAVHRPLRGGVICVAEGDGQVAGGAGQLLSGDGLAVQLIGNSGGHRQLLCSRALVVDVIAVCLPGDGTVFADREGLVSLYILDVRQLRVIRQGISTIGIFQPGADDGFCGVAVGVGNDVDGLLLARRVAVTAQQADGSLGDQVGLRRSIGCFRFLLRAAAGKARAQHKGRQHDGCRLLDPLFHRMIPPIYVKCFGVVFSYPMWSFR